MIPERPPYGRPTTYPPRANSSSGEADTEQDDSQAATDCPECGRHLPDMPTRYKESITHWGDKPLPVNNETFVARQKQADLVGRERPEY